MEASVSGRLRLEEEQTTAEQTENDAGRHKNTAKSCGVRRGRHQTLKPRGVRRGTPPEEKTVIS